MLSRFALFRNFSQQRIDVDESAVHHFFSCTNLGGRDWRVSTVAPFGDRFNGREVIHIAIAIAKKECLLNLGSVA